MPISHKLSKSLKSNNLKSHWNNSSYSLGMSLPLSLKKYIMPQFAGLFASQWFQTALEYFTHPPKIHIISIETKDTELYDIITELLKYINNNVNDNSNNIGNPSTSTYWPARETTRIRSILEGINPKHLTRTQRRAIRKYIEINPIGRDILRNFYEFVSKSGKLADDMELIFNPYTSLVNLAEIYSQCGEHSIIRFSVPELGIYDKSINLYYPPDKRDTYTSILNGSSDWLIDAITRICFYNRLLSSNKIPRAIHFFLADFRKEFMHVSGKADLIFTPSEINTGVCDMQDIIITRAEESLKTILHELIHFHSLDFKHAAHDQFCAELFNISTEQSSFNLFEAHTECLASIFHCLIKAINTHQEQSLNYTYQKNQKIQKILMGQIFYTIKKAAQILATSGCHNYAEFTNPEYRDKCQLRENTNVFSYFFVKSFIYLELQEWVSRCCNHKTATFIDTNTINGGQETLKEIIAKGYKNQIFSSIIDKEIRLTHRTQYRYLPKMSVRKTSIPARNSLKMVYIH